jgi:hypothetical protein
VESVALLNDGTSLYREGARRIDVQFRDIGTFVKQENISRINLMKINIEGGEYPLLRRMKEVGIIPLCDDIQVQFHDTFPDAARLRSEIREWLSRTHHLTYDYYFIWENWRRNLPDNT